MKVLVVTPTFGVYGGLETYVFGLADAAAQQSDVEMRLVFKASDDVEWRPEMQKAIYRCPVPVVIVRSASRGLKQQIDWADLVHLQNYSADVGTLAAYARTPLVVTVHGHRPARPPARMRAGEIACRGARARWYNSDFTWGTWERGERRRSSAVVSMRIPQFLNPLPSSERRGFVFASRWIANKGLDTLLEAYSKADLDRQEWPLVVLGDGPLRPSLQTSLEELAPHVTAPGFVTTQERTEFIRRARWLIAVPNTQEDLGLTPLEARECGVPCIVTRDGGVPEAAGPFSLQCGPGRADELQGLLELASQLCEDDYARMATATRNALRRDFSPLAAHLDLYYQVIQSRVQPMG